MIHPAARQARRAAPSRGRGALCTAFLLAASLLSGSAAAARPAPTPQLPVVTIPLAAWLASRPHALPDSLADFATDPSGTKQFRTLLELLVGRDWRAAAAQARTVAYMLVAIHEAGSIFIVASDDSGTGRDPTVVINMTPRRDFIVEAPHPPFEAGTAEQAVILLRDVGGRAAIVSGAHRCASRSFTTCDGTTDVCSGPPQGFRDSDAGHNVNTLFHAPHTFFAERWPSSIAMSLHGMSDDTEGARTSVIVSNGIRADDAAQKTAATRFRAAVGRVIVQPGAVVSCNLPADDVHGFRKLCGHTNVQGRHINGDADACHRSVDEGTGRFIHVEQDWSVRQPYSQGWNQIGRHRFNTAFISALVSVLPPVRISR